MNTNEDTYDEIESLDGRESNNDVDMGEVVIEYVIQDGWFLSVPVPDNNPTENSQPLSVAHESASVRALEDEDVQMVPVRRPTEVALAAQTTAPTESHTAAQGVNGPPTSLAGRSGPIIPIEADTVQHTDGPRTSIIGEGDSAPVAFLEAFRDEDVQMDLPTDVEDTDTSLTTDVVGPSTSRAIRFAETQERSDDQMLQNLMNILDNQTRSAIPSSPPNDARNVPTSITNVTSSQSDIGSHPSSVYPTTSNNGNSDNSNAGVPVERAEDVRPGTVSITRLDFLRFVHSMNSLSTEVRNLVGGQGSNNHARPTSHSNSHQAIISNINNVPIADSEEEEAQIRIYKKKSYVENRVHDIMRNTLVDFGLWTNRRRGVLSMKDSVPKSDVDGFVSGRCDGPTLNNLSLDWTEPMSSPWNSTAILILASHILQRIKDNFYPEIKFENWMTTDRLFEELKAKLTSSREEYEAMASNAPETDVDAAESRARYMAKKCQKKITNRRSMRRKTLYNCRLNIIKENLGSDPAWESALRLMHVVGDLAMSDDETDNERSTRRRKVVRRVEKPWASGPFKVMVNTLDLYYTRFYWDGYQKPGPGPRDRLSTIVSESPRRTPLALPKNCYSSMYLNSLSPYQRLKLNCKREMIIPVLPLPPS